MSVPASASPGSAVTGADWSRAAFSYEIQLRQLERSSTAAQGLLAAATLLGALAGPLLVLDAGQTWADKAVAALLPLYLVALGLSIRFSLAVLFTSRHGLESTPRGFVHYAHVSAHTTSDDFIRYFAGLDDGQQLERVLEQVWSLARLITSKAAAVRRATFWLSVGLVTLSVMLVLRVVSTSVL